MCDGTTKSGQPCRNRGSTKYCAQHKPAPVVVNIAESVAVSDAITEFAFPAAEPVAISVAAPVAIAYADDIAIAAIAEVAESIIAEIISVAIETAPIEEPISAPIEEPIAASIEEPIAAPIEEPVAYDSDDSGYDSDEVSLPARAPTAPIVESVHTDAPFAPYIAEVDDDDSERWSECSEVLRFEYEQMAERFDETRHDDKLAKREQRLRVYGGDFFIAAIEHSSEIRGHESFDFAQLIHSKHGYRVAIRDSETRNLCLTISVDETAQIAKYTYDTLSPINWTIWYSTKYVSPADLQAATIDYGFNQILSGLDAGRFAYKGDRLMGKAYNICCIMRDLEDVSLADALKTWLEVAAAKLGDKFDRKAHMQAWLAADATKANKLSVQSLMNILQVDDSDLHAKLNNIGKQEFRDREQKLYADLMERMRKLPKNLIREHNDWDVNALLLVQTFPSLDELAVAIKSCYALVLNNGDSRWFKKVVKSHQFPHSDELVWMITYAQSHYALKETFERSRRYIIQHDGHTYKLDLRSILHACWEAMAYTHADVIPHSPKVDPDVRQTFNLFPVYQHRYDPEFVIDQTLVDLWLNHIREILCAGDDECSEYLLSWFAHMLQRPAQKTKSCPIIKSAPGAGKNFVFTVFSRYVLSVDMATIVNDLDRITGKFNSMLMGKLLIVCDEALDSCNRKGNQIMKNRISEDQQLIEEKYQASVMVNDCSNYAILTNNNFQSIVERGDRRYLCLEALNTRCPKQPGAQEYWDMMHEKLMNPTAGLHIFHWLLRRDIRSLRISNLPETDYKRKLKVAQANLVVRYLLHLREIRINRDMDKADEDQIAQWKQDDMPGKLAFYQAFKDFATEYEPHGDKFGQSKVSEMLREAGFPEVRKKVNGSSKRWIDISLENLNDKLAEYITPDVSPDDE